jgi:hypothetical protein
MASNYINIASVFGLGVGEVFIPTNDPLYYTAADYPDVIIAKETMDAYPAYFRVAVPFSYSDKMAGIQAVDVDGYVWTPTIGDYFTTRMQEEDLWQILDDPATDFTVVKLTGNLSIESNPQDIAQAGFTDTYVRVFIPEAISGSASSGSASSGSASGSGS